MGVEEDDGKIGVCKNVTGDRGGSETLDFGCNFS